MKDYDVSIIVPIYNVEKYIEKCATTLLEQDYSNIEYIFVNDCTPDSSMKILKDIIERYPNRRSHVKIINKIKNEGLPQARKSGLKISSGKYILFVDSDDWIDIDMVSKMYNAAESNNADIVCCDMILHYKNRQVYKKDRYRDVKNNDKLKALVGGYILPSMTNKLIERKLLLNIVFKEFQFGEDVYIMTQLFYFSKNTIYIPEAFFHYNKLNYHSLSTKIDIRTVADIKDMYKSICEFLKSKGIYNELIKYHRTRLISVVFYNLNNDFVKNLKSIDKEAANIWLILKNNKFSILKKVICLLPFIGFDRLFKFFRDIYKR